MAQEGSTKAPIRHPVDWQDPDFYDEALLDAEMRRVFDICHGCRRCFNLCDSFPRLFDLIDAAPSGELDTVDSKDFAPVVEACTLCDICFVNKCPYVPPHEFNIDFPHLMLRYRATQRHHGTQREGKLKTAIHEAMAQTDRTGKISSALAPVVNWVNKEGNPLTRPLMEKALDIHRQAAIPKFHGKTLMAQAEPAPVVNRDAPAYGQKVALYATCFGNYNMPAVGLAARQVLAHNGVETKLFYPECCGMPQLESGDIAAVAARAQRIAAQALPLIEAGYQIIALVPSCALMLKSEWPLLLPEDPTVQRLAAATQDLSEYMVNLAKGPGLAPGLKPLSGGVSLHLACHARAQNMGPKGAEMLALIPETEVKVTERCSGHGGMWGLKTENFPVALKVGQPVVRQLSQQNQAYMTSECPLAGIHLQQGMALHQEKTGGKTPLPQLVTHPIELLAQAYGLRPEF